MNTTSTSQFSKVTSRGWVGIILSLSLILSINGDWRIPVGPTLMHPYLIILPFLLVIGKIKLFNVSSKLLTPLIFYIVFFSFPMLLEGSYPEILKIVAGVVTLLFFAQTVHSERDLEYCTWGFIIVCVYLSIKIILIGESGEASLLEGVNALSGLGNKNAQSQFILPGFFFICFNFFHLYKQKKIFRASLYIVLALPVILGSVLTGNRSGYLGILVIFLMLLVAFGLSFRAFAFMVVMLSISYYLVSTFAMETFERKYEQTTSGEFYSDELRKRLIEESLLLGVTNPFPGLGFRGLAANLAIKMNIPFRNEIDPHNLYGYLLGGGGVISFVSFFWFFAITIKQVERYRKYRNKVMRILKVTFYDRQLPIWLLGFIGLYLFRSFFTRELIYSPNFMGAFGLLIGALFFYKRKLAHEIKS